MSGNELTIATYMTKLSDIIKKKIYFNFCEEYYI